MNAEPQPLAEAQKSAEGWSLQRWVLLIVFALAAHLALISIFGAKKVPAPRPVVNVPQLQLAGGNHELIALTDPTLFALPHDVGFDAFVGLQLNAFAQQSFRWTEPPPFLPISPATLGANFAGFMQTNRFSSAPLDFKPEPQVTLPFVKIESALPQVSTFQLVGEIAQRRMLNQIEVPSLPYNDVIKPSRVQVLVDEQGNVASDVLLGSSEYAAADQMALELARTARFAPQPGLRFGEMIFNWHTVATTNAP